ncbi:MAG: peptidoglycan-binding protein [Clostridiales bacterium]|nr:peptidoglycan-binding protein [Clostridiales bacterium]
MDEGQLDINVCDIDVGRPIPNALVSISTSGRPEDVVEELTTDSSGQTPRITLPTPPIDYSLSPSEPKPFSEYDVRISMDGFEPVTVERVQIFPESTALQSICLHPADSFEISPEAIVIPDPVLWGQYPSKIPENPVKELPPSTGFVVLSKPVVPETIVVHSGAPSNASAQNYWVPFKDYIKNVASSEIYANWPEATLRANILAIISLTLNRVYTEWYRSKGYSFTITNSTAYDQAFTYGRNIFEEISVVVDDVFTTYITKPNIRQPLFSQYCDGKRTVCPNWMSQWGSKDLGDQGYSAIEILKKYYGNDVYLMQAEKVEGVPVSFPGTTLQVGSSGPNVRVVQEQINAIANNYPALKKLNVDGAYGESTKASVMKFQEIFKLPASGVVDFSTWYKLSAIYVAVTRMAEGV